MKEKLKGKARKESSIRLEVPSVHDSPFVFDEYRKEPEFISLPREQIAKEAKEILIDLERKDQEDKIKREERKKRRESDPLYKAVEALVRQSELLIDKRDSVKSEIGALSKKKDAESEERVRIGKEKLHIIREELNKVSNKAEDISDEKTKNFRIENADKVVRERIAVYLIGPSIEKILPMAENKTESLLRLAIKNKFKGKDLSSLSKANIASLSGYVSTLLADKLRPDLREYISSIAYEEFLKTGVLLADFIRPNVLEFMTEAYEKLKVDFSDARAKELREKKKEIEEAASREGMKVEDLSNEEVEKLWSLVRKDKQEGLMAEAEMQIREELKENQVSLGKKMVSTLKSTKDYIVGLSEAEKEYREIRKNMEMQKKGLLLFYLGQKVFDKVHKIVNDSLPHELRKIGKALTTELTSAEVINLYSSINKKVLFSLYPISFDADQASKLKSFEDHGQLLNELVIAETYRFLDEILSSNGVAIPAFDKSADRLNKNGTDVSDVDAAIARQNKNDLAELTSGVSKIPSKIKDAFIEANTVPMKTIWSFVKKAWDNISYFATDIVSEDNSLLIKSFGSYEKMKEKIESYFDEVMAEVKLGFSLTRDQIVQRVLNKFNADFKADYTALKIVHESFGKIVDKLLKTKDLIIYESLPPTYGLRHSWKDLELATRVNMAQQAMIADTLEKQSQGLQNQDKLNESQNKTRAEIDNRISKIATGL
ncbi:MAG: hypothetical protein HY225_02075 [Candidatus Vogelbacteria bacterium]|nr:hypothetical protein [Candidatus Vogelbacteria bacterium]